MSNRILKDGDSADSEYQSDRNLSERESGNSHRELKEPGGRVS
ncbi:hypothetical protein [Paenibacillus silvestris]|nr:hypothetical protein [Paenibacillus silvestris]